MATPRGLLKTIQRWVERDHASPRRVGKSDAGSVYDRARSIEWLVAGTDASNACVYPVTDRIETAMGGGLSLGEPVLNGARPVRVKVRVKRHRTARKLSLRLKHTDLATLTIPYRLGTRQALAFLEQHKAWLIEQASMLESTVPSSSLTGQLSLPLRVSLTAIGLNLEIVTTSPVAGAEPDWREFNKPLPDLHGSFEPMTTQQVILKRQRLSVKALQTLVATHARAILLKRLQAQATVMGVSFNKLQLGWPYSRWGSCSSTGTISINCRVLFLATRHLEYLLVHELAHRIEPNHSLRFWAIVTEYCPNHLAIEREFKSCTMRSVPL